MLALAEAFSREATRADKERKAATVRTVRLGKDVPDNDLGKHLRELLDKHPSKAVAYVGKAEGLRNLGTLPVLLLTVFAQRQIVAGLTAGAVKGG